MIYITNINCLKITISKSKHVSVYSNNVVNSCDVGNKIPFCNSTALHCHVLYLRVYRHILIYPCKLLP